LLVAERGEGIELHWASGASSIWKVITRGSLTR
jgi:hypothetical protein